MKTTIDLPDELLIAAKKRAAELRRPLRSLVEAGLRAEIAAPVGRRGRRRVRIRWVTVAGGVAAELDLADRRAMHEWLGRHETAR